MNILKFRPPRIALLYIVIALIPSFFFFRVILYPYNLIGIFVILIGFWIMMRAWLLFKKKDNAICPTAKTTNLFTTGVYKISRNPMYLGMLIILVGISILSESIITFLAPIAFFITINKVFIPFEEKKMEKTFGADYVKYKNKVRKWI